MQKSYSWSVGVRHQINPLKALYHIGQSPWYDNIERRLFKSGEFGLLINEYGIVGVTSNPAIFEKAICASSDYDAQIKTLLGANKSSYKIYDELTIEDVACAADMLLSIYENTNGIDGYVSIEVLPEYAYDAKKTIDYARELFKRLKRRNILIKVPGTKQGCLAIRKLISEGINVNVTLLFSISQYRDAASAYIDGINDRAKKGLRLEGIASVASVFVSRVDTRVDKILDELAAKEKDAAKKKQIMDLRGRAAVANCKMIYQCFKEIFMNDAINALREKGASIQRVLWASTSVKNPNYNALKYVEELVAPDSINTMPHQTVLEFYEHGFVRSMIERDLDEAKNILEELRLLGVDLNAICENLQKEGIKAFEDSFKSLISSIDNKAQLLTPVKQ